MSFIVTIAWTLAMLDTVNKSSFCRTYSEHLFMHVVARYQMVFDVVGILDEEQAAPTELVRAEGEFIEHDAQGSNRSVVLGGERGSGARVELSVLGGRVVVEIGDGLGRIEREDGWNGCDWCWSTTPCRAGLGHVVCLG